MDAHAAAGITDLLINVNGQRTNYRSDVWEAMWEGYDPNLRIDQPFFAEIDPKRRMGPDACEAKMYMDILAFHKQGGDHPKLMIDRARHNKLKAWISLRMNDGHLGWIRCNGASSSLEDQHAPFSERDPLAHLDALLVDRADVVHDVAE